MTTTPTDIDRLLAHAVLRWARAEGWTSTYVICCYRNPTWTTEVYWSSRERWLAIQRNATETDLALSVMVPVSSVREAVDVLAAYRIIPIYFSSAYGAGRASARVSTWGKEVAPCFN